MVLDGAAIGDVDYTAASVLRRVAEQLRQQGIRWVLASLLPQVRRQLDRYGLSAAIGPDAYYDTPGEALEAFHAAVGIEASRSRTQGTTHLGEARKRP
jgi:anti-anti-sigma regulatory factor